MAVPESRPSAPPEVLGEKPSPLVIRTRTERGVRWEAQFHFRHADGLSQLRSRSRIPHPEKPGTLEEYDVRVARTSEGVGAAAHLVREHVSNWAIHWARVGETEIRGRSERAPVGIKDEEVDGLMDAISHQVQLHTTK